MKRILVVGSLNIDLTLPVARLPKPGETVLAGQLAFAGGGKGANQAAAAARLGGSVRMLGCVGTDIFAETVLDSLSLAGVDISRIARQAELPTGTAVVCVEPGGENAILVSPGANAACTTEYLQANDDAFLACDFLLLQCEIPLNAVWYAIERAHALGKTVLLNPAPAPEGIPPAILAQVDYLIPNETELIRLAPRSPDGDASLTSIARQLLQQDVGHILVTLGAGGALLLHPAGQQVFPTFPVKTVDTTAAGDCFNGAFAVALAEGRPLPEAILFAHAAAALSTTRHGAQPSLPSRAQAEALLAEA